MITLQHSKRIQSKSMEKITKPPKFSSKTARRKMVTFATVAHVRETIHLNDLNKSEMDDMWYTMEDYNAFLSDCFETIRSVELLRPLSNAHQSFRGLEKMTFQGDFQRQQVRLYSRAVVFEEQQFQRTQGFRDFEFLANVYQEYAMESNAEAHVTALRDRQEVLLAVWSEFGVPYGISKENRDHYRWPSHRHGGLFIS